MRETIVKTYWSLKTSWKEEEIAYWVNVWERKSVDQRVLYEGWQGGHEGYW